MAKGPYITQEIKRLISRIYLKDRAIGPSKGRKELLKEMKAKGLDRNFGPDYPSVSSVSIELKRCRKNDEERPLGSRRLDEPWSLGSLIEYPIPYEALPTVMSIREKCAIQGGDYDLTIREALWIGRLNKIIELYQPQHIPPDVRHILMSGKWENPEDAWPISKIPPKLLTEDVVLDCAYYYAKMELLSEIEGESFDSGELDTAVMHDVYEFYGERRRDAISLIAEEYGADEDKLMALNLTIQETRYAAVRLTEDQEIRSTGPTQLEKEIEPIKSKIRLGWGPKGGRK